MKGGLELETEDKKRQLRNKQDMSYIRDNMPDIWHMIVSTRCCPIHLGLQKYCSLAIPDEEGQTCEDCWNQAIQIDNPVLIVKGMYYCPACHKPLTVVKIENGQQQWRCDACHKTYVVPTGYRRNTLSIMAFYRCFTPAGNPAGAFFICG